jgi:hypothetical protein
MCREETGLPIFIQMTNPTHGRAAAAVDRPRPAAVDPIDPSLMHCES